MKSARGPNLARGPRFWHPCKQGFAPGQFWVLQRLLTEFLNKIRSGTSLEHLLKNIDSTGAMERQQGSEVLCLDGNHCHSFLWIDMQPWRQATDEQNTCEIAWQTGIPHFCASYQLLYKYFLLTCPIASPGKGCLLLQDISSLTTTATFYHKMLICWIFKHN